MNFLKNRFSKAVLGVVVALSLFSALQGCGSTSSDGCCQVVKLSDKIKEVEKVTVVPEVKGDQIVYVDRNVTVIQYVDRNVTVIQYVDRNVTVDVIKVRPDARISGLVDGEILKDTTILAIDSVDSFDVDGNVTKYQWMLDDINISTEKNPNIDLPTDPGTHKLCLTVIDNDNLDSLKTCKIFVIPEPNKNPTAAIRGLNDGVVKSKCSVLVSGDTSIGDSEIVSYTWVIDGNQTLTGKDQNLSFDTLGEHEVCLTVVDSNDLNNTNCSTVDVKDHVSPAAILTFTDPLDNEAIILPTKQGGKLLTRGNTYNMSCEGSHDDCNTTVPVACEWNAHSYRIDSAGNKVDYVRDCIDHNNAPQKGMTSFIKLCGTPISAYKYIEIELKVTDQFGKTATRTDIFEVAP